MDIDNLGGYKSSHFSTYFSPALHKPSQAPHFNSSRRKSIFQIASPFVLPQTMFMMKAQKKKKPITILHFIVAGIGEDKAAACVVFSQTLITPSRRVVGPCADLALRNFYPNLSYLRGWMDLISKYGGGVETLSDYFKTTNGGEELLLLYGGQPLHKSTHQQSLLSQWKLPRL